VDVSTVCYCAKIKGTPTFVPLPHNGINVLAAIEGGGFGGASQQGSDLAGDAAAEFEERSDHRHLAKGGGLMQG
jgi:hypothetical protein